jgi:hypothetical protein
VRAWSCPENVGTTPARITGVTPRGERYHALMAAIAAWLPFGLSRIAAPSILGFAIINGSPSRWTSDCCRSATAY